MITIRRPYIWNSFVIATDFPINLQFFLLFWTTIFGRLGKIPKVLKKLINDLDESCYPLFEMVLRWHNYLLQKNLGKGQFVAKKKACATKLLQTFIGTIASTRIYLFVRILFTINFWTLTIRRLLVRCLNLNCRVLLSNPRTSNTIFDAPNSPRYRLHAIFSYSGFNFEFAVWEIRCIRKIHTCIS